MTWLCFTWSKRHAEVRGAVIVAVRVTITTIVASTICERPLRLLMRMNNGRRLIQSRRWRLTSERQKNQTEKKSSAAVGFSFRAEDEQVLVSISDSPSHRPIHHLRCLCGSVPRFICIQGCFELMSSMISYPQECQNASSLTLFFAMNAIDCQPPDHNPITWTPKSFAIQRDARQCKQMTITNKKCGRRHSGDLKGRPRAHISNLALNLPHRPVELTRNHLLLITR